MIENELDKIRSAKHYYRDHYRRAVKILLVCAMIILTLLALNLFIALKRIPPNYYATSSDGMLWEVAPAEWGARLPDPETYENDNNN